MAFAPNDVVRVTVDQTYDTQTCLNVFYYKINDPFTTPYDPADLGMLFWEWVEENWRGLVNVSVIFNRVIIENLDGDLDYGEYIIPPAEQNGLHSGEQAASFLAFALQLNRTSRLTRQGAKRLVGVSETHMNVYGVLTLDAKTRLQNVADDFAMDLVAGLVTIMHPVIVGFPNDNRPDRVEVPIDTATAKDIVSSQNSRKRGHGS